jgi:uncharacterized protein (TIRG00374 family)
VRAAALLGVNLLLGLALLAWLLATFGGAALELLAADPSPALGLLFLVLATVAMCTFAWRWRMLLAGLGLQLATSRLALYRSAGLGLASLVPSGRVGADPLRAWLAARDTPAAGAIAGVAVDRGLEMGAASAFGVVFVSYLLSQGIPELNGALVALVVSALALVGGALLAVARLRRGAGLVSALVRGARLDRVQAVQSQLGLIEAAEADFARLADQHRLLARAFVVGLLANALLLLETHLLLAALGLPASLVAVVAATFATAGSHMVPVPAGFGVLEGAHVWLFGMLGHPPEVGLAVGLAMRVRELVWMLPGLAYLLGRGAGASLRVARGG